MQYTPDDESSINRLKDAEWDQQSLIDDDGSNSATTFNPDDGDATFRMSDDLSEAQDRWFQLRKLNDGVGEEDRIQQNRDDDRIEDIHLIASKCDLTKREVQTAKRLVREINFRFGPGITVDDTLMAIIIISSYDENRIWNDEGFNDIMNNWGLDTGTIERAISLIEGRMNDNN